MSETESWQVSTEAAEVYESCFVPAIFGAWATTVTNAANVGSGDNVLDVACGTGVVAREAIRRVGGDGQVTGVDINEGMLAIAQQKEPNVEWRKGDAASLPFEDESFDAVTCQYALMYFPDRAAAIREMWRVLKPGGRLAVAVWASIEQSPGYQILVDVATQHVNAEAAQVLAAPFVLGDAAELVELFAVNGITDPKVTLHDGTIRFSSVEEFVRIEVKGSPLAEQLSDEALGALTSASEDALKQFVLSSGEIELGLDGNIVTATK